MPVQPRPRRPRWLLGSMGLLALLGFLFLLFNRLVETELKPLIIKGLEKAAQGPVSFSSVGGNLSGDVVLKDLTMDLPGSPWQAHLQTSQVGVNLDLWNLLLKKKALENCVRSLTIVKPRLTLIRVQPQPPGAVSSASVSIPPPGPHPFTPPVFLVPAPRLFVKEGSLQVKAGKDAQKLVTGVDFEAFSNDGNDWSLVLSAQPADPTAGGSLRFTGSLHMDLLKISGKMDLTDWPLAQAGILLQDLAGWQLTGGKLDAECPVVYQPDRGLWFDTRVKLHDASIVSPKPLAASFDQINGRVWVRPNEIEIPGDLTFSTSGTPWTAHGLVPLDGKPIQVQASTTGLLLSSLSSGLLKLKGTPWEGHGKASLAVEGTFQKPFLTADADLGPSKIGDIVLDGFKAQARYEDGILQMTSLEGNLYDGTFSAQGQIGLTGQANAPLSITADLRNLDTGKLFLAYGLKEFLGKTQAQVQLTGTLQNPVVSALNQADFDATDTHDAYSMQNIFKWEDGVITLNSKINGQDQMQTEVRETADGWKVQQAELRISKNGGRLIGSGFLPKDPEKTIDLTLQTPKGGDITLEKFPFFHERFRDISGPVTLNIHVFGTKHNPEATVDLFGPNVTIMKSASASTKPGSILSKPMTCPLTVDLYLSRASAAIKRLEYGPIFSAQGRYGLGEETVDLIFNAQGFPLPTLAELSGWPNPPQPLEGFLTGRLHLSGLEKNPVLEGDAVLSQFKMGDWWADQVEASMNRDQGKLLVRKLKLTQGSNSLIASGSWDTGTQPGQMALRFFAKNFQMGKGPFVSGNFLWEAQTGEPWFNNWTGRFSSEAFSLGDGKTNHYSFPRLTMDAETKDWVLDGKFQLGDAVAGRANINLGQKNPLLKGSLAIAPTLISKMPELVQFLPASMKLSGTLSGKISFGPGSWDTLPMEGNVQITDGLIAKKFSFESLSLSFEGDRTHLEPAIELENKKSTYELSGTLDSSKGFWDPDCKVALKGPFNDSLDRLLLFFPELDPGKHRTAGSLKGELTVGGTWSRLNFDFSMSGENLQFDDNQVVSGILHCGYSDGRMFLDKTRLTLPEGEINIERGSLVFDPADASHLSLSIAGSTQGLSISLFHLTNKVNLTGDLYLNETAEKPTFAGSLSILDSDPMATKTNPFELNIRVKRSVVELLPLASPKPQLTGVLDLSQADKIIFQQIKLLNAPGAFSVDGTLDLKGESHLTSDAKDIPIQDVAKWVLPDFPLRGMANYHMIFDGPLSHPIMTTSLTVNGGQIGQLKFDLFTADLKAKDDTLFLGSEETPVEISRSGLFDFTVYGETPLALTASTRVETKNREMDLTAKMEKGDFSILLAAGLAKEAGGAMTFDAHLRGTLDNPVFSTLDLGLSKCRMVPSMIAQSLEDINGRVKVRDNKLAVEDLNFQVGQGRVFITSPPIEKSKMVLENFIPQTLDFMVRTVGDHGLWLNIPDIMAKGEWGEIYFYGQKPEDPLLITGSLNEPHVIGTALLDTGHYTFPPVEEMDEHGEKIDYKELANVYFELNLVSGKNTWYSNDSNTNYLDLQVDPGDVLTITGKDSNRTAEEAGIMCTGRAGSSRGTLRYLSHEFKLQEATMNIPKGKLPFLEGSAADKFANVELLTPGGSVQQTDMDVFVNFKGTFGNIDFTLDSNPRFNTTDKVIQQKVLLSYIIFGKDMTGYSGQTYSSQQLQQIYQQQNLSQVASSALVDAINRVGTNYISSQLRPLFNPLGFELKVKGSPLPGGTGPGSIPTPGAQSPEAAGNTLVVSSLPVFQIDLTKNLSPHLSVEYIGGPTREINGGLGEWSERFGVNYLLSKNWNLSGSVGQNDINQNEERVEMRYKTELPDIISPKPGDKEKPRFEQTNYYPMGKGKYHLVWELDKTNRSEVRVFDSSGTMTQVIQDKSGWGYKHELDVENLSESQDYKILITAKDPNGNEAVTTLKIPSVSE